MRFKAHARAGNYCDKRGAQPWHLFRVANILATCPWPSFLFITPSTPSFLTLATLSRPGPKRLILLTEIYQNFAKTIDSDSRTWNIQHNTFKNMTLNECWWPLPLYLHQCQHRPYNNCNHGWCWCFYVPQSWQEEMIRNWYLVLQKLPPEMSPADEESFHDAGYQNYLPLA